MVSHRFCWGNIPMDMEHKEEQLEQETEGGQPDLSQLNAVERFYERFRGVPLRNLDIFIGICIGMFVLVVVLGMLKGWGIL